MAPLRTLSGLAARFCTPYERGVRARLTRHLPPDVRPLFSAIAIA